MMKKTMLLFSMIITISMNVFSQTGIDEAPTSNYIKETGGVFYLILQPDEIDIEITKTQLDQLKEQPEFGSMRVSTLKINDTTFGEIMILVARRFQNIPEAQSYLETMEKKSIILNNKPLIISQSNYRKFLRKQDIEEYRNFIEN